MNKYTVSFVGAGRVAGALCRRLHDKGVKIRSIVSRKEPKGKSLASECGAIWNTLLKFSEQDEIIIVAVPDDSLPGVLSAMDVHESTIVAHTAGSFGLEIFPSRFGHTGVFYPLQTFTAGREVNFEGLPFFLEASDPPTLENLSEIAELTGGSVYKIGEHQRQLLHVAAVFVNNFTNHMLTTGKLITDSAGVPFSLLEPLIMETVDKAFKMGPEASQTGPASRSDEGTIERHINLLSFSPELQKLYIELTGAIIAHYKKAGDDKL